MYLITNIYQTWHAKRELPLTLFILAASQMFEEWMAHETFAETRRQIFIRTPELEGLLEEMSEFACSALLPQSPDTSAEQEQVQSYSFSSLLRKK